MSRKSDVATRKEEGLSQVSTLLYGEEISDHVEIEEFNCHFYVDVKKGQKTGVHSTSERTAGRWATWPQGRESWTRFCYTGAFSIHEG